jgi:hypothetical protein
MSRSNTQRRAIQTFTVRSVLTKYLEGQPLELAIRDLNDAMRTGPQAWAFKRAPDPEPQDDTIYYTSGGNV